MNRLEKIPELLAPAGSLQRLKVAFSYGADAVYLAGQKYGLRSATDNFTNQEIREGVAFAHQMNGKVYCVINSFLHDKDFLDLADFILFLKSLEIDAIIASDLGVIKTIQQHAPNISIHLSTQASCLNSYAARAWRQLGVKRIIVERNLSILQAQKIKESSGLAIEMFIHGSMCMAYAGNCNISNYCAGRDSNRGGCNQACRFEYVIDKNKNTSGFFLSSKDLLGLKAIASFTDLGIDSLKIEGRMRGDNYCGTVVKIYAQALNHYKKHRILDTNNLTLWRRELESIAHRDYFSGNLLKKNEEKVFSRREVSSDEESFCAGITVAVSDNDFILVEVKRAFLPKDCLELVPFTGASIKFSILLISDIYNNPIEKSKPSTLVKLPYIRGAAVRNIIRQRAKTGG